ncbi:MAG TPA: hypothetical protein VIE65_00155 [Methylobacter sp.]|jgi:hypothetical protein
MRHLVIAIVIALFCYVPSSLADGPIRVAYLVICDDASVSKQISTAIETRLEKANFEISDKLPKAKLVIYAQKDINDRINTNGWSFAVAHVTNKPTYFVAAKLLNSDSAEAKAVEPALMDILRSDGILTYLNVSHIDKLDDGTLAILTDNFVGEFAKRAKD